MRWDIASMSEHGERKNNEDCVEVAAADAGICAVLCDGLGGHDAGELASKCVCESIIADFEKAPEDADIYELVCELIQSAQDELLKKQIELDNQGGMKTTVCCLLLQNGKAAAAYVGDSRIYQFRKKRLLSRSVDHSVPQYLVNVGEIRESEIRHHPDRNKLLRVMGSEWESPRYQRMTLSEPLRDDAFLLCTDGFWEWIEEKEMESMLKRASCSEEWLCNMKKLIYTRGSGKKMDNLSAIAIRQVDKG
ncbi:MAG: protein phosphatase 2C domain-containing protein [Candidatus Limivicinus sp.]|nr:protein phosphatase 2C domain-containing protein [Clostridiales bacterium]MDY3859964.1 protein phosphatase 2C domain-containing protein [Candidatus Limivicinus sp.]